MRQKGRYLDKWGKVERNETNTRMVNKYQHVIRRGLYFQILLFSKGIYVDFTSLTTKTLNVL